MYSARSVLFLEVSIWLLLPNVNASPLRATTTVDEFRMTQTPVPTEPQTINFSSVSSMFCQDNVRSKGCQPPASLAKKDEPSVPTPPYVKHCNFVHGECLCHPSHPGYRDICFPLRTARGVEATPIPIPTPTETSSMLDWSHCKDPHDSACSYVWGHPASDDFYFVQTFTPTEAELTPTSTSIPFPTRRGLVMRDPYSNHPVPQESNELAKGEEEHRPILETRAVDGTRPHHTLSPSDNEAELSKRVRVRPPPLCHNDPDCIGWHALAKAEKEEKRDVVVALPTATGTSEVKIDAECSGSPYLC